MVGCLVMDISNVRPPRITRAPDCSKFFLRTSHSPADIVLVEINFLRKRCRFTFLPVCILYVLLFSNILWAFPFYFETILDAFVVLKALLSLTKFTNIVSTVVTIPLIYILSIYGNYCKGHHVFSITMWTSLMNWTVFLGYWISR